MNAQIESPDEAEYDPIYDLTVAMTGVLVLLPKLENSDARVLLAIIRECLVENQCPSAIIRLGKLADLAGVHRSTLTLSLDRLHDAGLIEIAEDTSKQLLQPPMIFRVNVEELAVAGVNDEAMCALFYPGGVNEELPAMA